MKKKWTENTALAVLALVLAAAAGIVGIGGVKARSAAAEPYAYYQTEMASDFALRESAAETILSLAQQQGVDPALIGDAQAALDESRAQAESPADRYRAGTQLKMTVELVYNSLPAAQRDGKGSPAQMAWSEFTSRTSILSHLVPEYNELARETRQKLSGFPARLLAGGASLLEEMA